MKLLFLLKRFISISAIAVFISANATAAQLQEKPILVIGASFENGLTPVDDNLKGPFAGYASYFGTYLSLGDALLRDERLSGYVINEARAGSTTYERHRCGPTSCLSVGWKSMEYQYKKALMRVVVRDASGNVVRYNTDYIVIGMPNDCLHSGSKGKPQLETKPCSTQEFNETIDYLSSIAQDAVSKGITPVFNIMPKYEDIDLQKFKALGRMAWVIDEKGYNEFRNLIQTRIKTEIPDALIVDTWAEFEGREPDGLHPTYETAVKGAKRVAQAINRHRAGK